MEYLRHPELFEIKSPADLDEAAILAAENHQRLRTVRPFLKARDADHFRPKLAWLAGHGRILGLRASDPGGRDGSGGSGGGGGWVGVCGDGSGEPHLQAFLGGFVIEDFRNAGPGALCPDWAHASSLDAGTQDQALNPGQHPAPAQPGRTPTASPYPALYRALAEGWAEEGIRIHAAGLYATEAEALETFSLLGFGRIVMDAAAPVASILDAVPPQPYGPSLASRPSVAIRPAEANRDLAALVWMNAALAAHIGAPPVFMPRTRGADGQEWEAWFREPEAVALIAEYGGEACGYIKAQAPQFDVSDAVRYQGVLGINGLYVDPACRGKGIATALLRGLAEYAREAGYGTVSVDCETTNPEAYRFWTRFFEPVGWSLERRI